MFCEMRHKSPGRNEILWLLWCKDRDATCLCGDSGTVRLTLYAGRRGAKRRAVHHDVAFDVLTHSGYYPTI